jgi:phosphoserine phosphatase RsbU/P
MPTSATVTVGPATWTELLALARGEGRQRAYLERLMELWQGEREAGGAALYLERDGGFRREIDTGEGRFPESLGDGRPAGFLTLPLPGGLLLATEPADGPPPAGDPLSVALAGGVRALRLERQLKEKHFQANYRGVELEALYDVGLAIASTLDLDRLAEEVLLRAVSLLDARRGALYLLEDGRYRLDRTFGGDARPSFAADENVEGLIGDDGAAAADLLPGARYLLAVPIESDGRRRGLLLVGDKESRSGVGPFPDHDRRTLALFANQAAIALENARLHRQALEKERLEREMELAAEIQRQILPDRVPAVAGYDLAGWNRPARQVGGDYYDLAELAGDRLGLALGDVTGKGMPAALMVSTLHSALKLLRDRCGLCPDLLAQLNRHIFDSSAANKFITLIVAELEAASGRFAYVNAGHNPGLLLRSGGGLERLDAGGVPLGLFAASAYERREVNLERGDLVCLYSDGITECASPADEEFGEDRLIHFLTERRAGPLDALIADLDRATADFCHHQPQGDDQTVILLRRDPVMEDA